MSSETTTAVAKVETKPNALGKVKNTDELPISDAVKVLMTSGLVKDSESAGKLLAKISFGRSLGLSDIAAINGVSFSPNGTLILSAALMLALIKRSGKYRMEYKQRSDKVCEIQMHEKVDGQWFSCGTPCKFTWEDAVRAKLSTKPTYAQFPTQMLTARCIADCFRTHCSDTTGVAVYTPEEIPEAGLRTDPESGEIVPEAEYEVKPKPSTKPTSTPTLSPRQELEQLMMETDAGEKFLSIYGAKTVEELAEGKVAHAVSVLKARKNATPKGG